MQSKNQETRKWTTKRILLEILSRLGEASLTVIDEGFLNPKYPFTHISRELFGLDTPEKDFKNIKKVKEQRKVLFSATLSRLKQEGFIASSGNNRNTLWRLTSSGANHVKQINIDSSLPAKDSKLRLVVFDIPEKERGLRDRIRTLLSISEYKPLQRSVWIGERPLREKIFKEITQHNIQKYIHMFEIKERGSIPKNIFQE